MTTLLRFWYVPKNKRFGHIRLLPVLMGCWLLFACAGDPARHDLPDQTALADKTNVLPQTPASRYVDRYHETLYKLLVADLAKGRKDYALSAAYFYELAESTRNPRYAGYATQVALYNKDYAKAREAVELWVKLEPDSSEARQILVGVLLRNGRPEQALQHLDALVDSLDTVSDRHVQMLIRLLNQNKGKDKKAAIATMEKIVDKRGRDPDILLLYAYLLLDAKQLDRAIEVLDDILRLQPGHTAVIPLYVQVLRKQNKLPQAATWMRRILKKYPKHSEWRLLYAELLISAEQPKKALQQYKILLAKSPGNPEILYPLGLLSLQMNKHKAAKGYFKRLLAHEKLSDTARYYLGHTAESEKNVKEAIKWYRQIYEGSYYLRAQVRIALLLADQGQVDEAVAQLRSIESADSEEAIGLIQLESEIFVKQKRHEDAITVCDRGLRIYPDNIDLLYMRALLAEKIDRMDITERDLRHILEINPKHVDTLNALGYTLADKTDRYEEAFALIEQAKKLKPGAFYILDSYGWVLYRLKRHQEAIRYLRKALEIKNDPEIAAHLVEVLWMTGHRENAREVWENAAKKFPDDKNLQETLERLMDDKGKAM